MLVVSWTPDGTLGCHARRPKDLRRAKYELQHTVRVHLGCEDDAFGCMGNGEDSDGIKVGPAVSSFSAVPLLYKHCHPLQPRLGTLAL
jgi:hypothetical protein